MGARPMSQTAHSAALTRPCDDCCPRIGCPRHLDPRKPHSARCRLLAWSERQPDQLSIPYQRHSDTSMAAAVGIEPNAMTLLRDVLLALRSWRQEGATDQEIQDALSMDPSTERPRRVELVKRGLVKDSGRTRLTRSGRKATVWVACD